MSYQVLSVVQEDLVAQESKNLKMENNFDIIKNTAQIEVESVLGSVYLYAENGKSVIAALHRALKKEQNWQDPDYLARMIFCEMIPLSQLDTTEGFGIGTEMYANIDLIIRVCPFDQTIVIQSRSTSIHDKSEITFSEFIKSFASSAKL